MLVLRNQRFLVIQNVGIHKKITQIHFPSLKHSPEVYSKIVGVTNNLENLTTVLDGNDSSITTNTWNMLVSE